MKELTKELKLILKEEPEIINFNRLCEKYILPIEFINCYGYKFEKIFLYTYQNLPETFINKYIRMADEKDIDAICTNQTLSEGFMSKYKDKLNWEALSTYQNMSEGFIRAHIEYVDLDNIALSKPNLGKEFFEEFKDKIDWGYVKYFYNENCQTPVL